MSVLREVPGGHRDEQFAVNRRGGRVGLAVGSDFRGDVHAATPGASYTSEIARGMLGAHHDPPELLGRRVGGKPDPRGPDRCGRIPVGQAERGQGFGGRDNPPVTDSISSGSSHQ